MTKRPRIYKKVATSNPKTFRHRNLVVTIYTSRPSDLAKTTPRHEIPLELWNKWSIKQQELYTKQRNRFILDLKLTEEIQAVFRSNKLLQEYA